MSPQNINQKIIYQSKSLFLFLLHVQRKISIFIYNKRFEDEKLFCFL